LSALLLYFGAVSFFGLDANGKLTKMYKNWGSKVTRTPDAQDVEEAEIVKVPGHRPSMP
jgi:hypothetical protein